MATHKSEFNMEIEQYRRDSGTEKTTGGLPLPKRTKIYGGYTKERDKSRTEGERWTDAQGDNWVREGKFNIKNPDSLEALAERNKRINPLWCPECGRIMNGIHPKIFRAKGHCLDCAAKKESDDIISGKHDEIHAQRKKELENGAWERRIINERVDRLWSDGKEFFSRDECEVLLHLIQTKKVDMNMITPYTVPKIKELIANEQQ